MKLSQVEVEKLYNKEKHNIPHTFDKGAGISIALRANNICPCCIENDVIIVSNTTFICSRCGGEYEKFNNYTKPKVIDNKPRQLTLF